MTAITYSQQGDYWLPNLLPPQQPTVPLGKYASMRSRYLEEHQKITYMNLMTSGKLNQHLQEIEQTARTRIEQMVSQIAQTEGLTEELKATDQMKWVGLMNNIKASAEEQILAELIYA